ncbi:two-component system, LytT family, sensor kinase [Natronincola peptidivorans]|uniref:Two-component system, LytT family, sensor kinase n=1 Tax=Natronincola peptidivorans TaxID=426128 RepID=A0A1I0DQA4_9FIRM|nr:histidine kinase N-terminal 7TM domain-containing protein [Natronincola peptidivorans]SET34582.1 two-component system, LytT family, sensor kinase [Natronincola peptidivorans]
MNMVQLTFTLVLLGTIFCAIALILYAYKRRGMPGANYFIMLLMAAIVYSGAYIGEINANDFSTAMFWFHLQHIPIPIQHYLWMVMSLEYARVSKKHLKIAKYAGLYHPILYMLIYYTNHLHHLYISSYSFESNGYFSVIISTKEPLFFLLVASGTSLGIISMFFYIRGLLRTSKFHRYGYFIMIIASIFPWITVYLNATNNSYLGIDYFPVVSVLSGFLYVFGIFYFRIFNTIPIATETVFKQSREGIILIDLRDHIIDVNDAVTKLYPVLKAPSYDYTFTSFLESHPELKGISEENPITEFKLPQNGEERYYSAQITKISGEDSLEIGKILTITDITLFVENQKTLEYIASTAIDKAETSEISFLQAQINPHFLNNTLSVIGAMIKRDPDGARELIGNLGEYLTNSCYFDHTNPMVLLEDELEAVNTYVAIEKTRFGDRLNFHIVCKDTPKVHIPRLILQPLVENSIRHGILRKAEGGNVWLTISQDDRKISFEIKDDGVGIPRDKLQGLTKEEKEDQGIGIYNIHRRLLKHYGEGLKIESKEAAGTSVIFSIPYQSPTLTG